eukprot:TRINITY_DN61774_c0_g1_i1.p1 TRINITY_DN61774_c0_g1~~TRINITY_DN61774_c0_g1_i1.p1  ORF type:complete len:831 (+),score=79.58 TRINITY_DN61774_c0_g1_i1:58-2550(+)
MWDDSAPESGTTERAVPTIHEYRTKINRERVTRQKDLDREVKQLSEQLDRIKNKEGDRTAYAHELARMEEDRSLRTGVTFHRSRSLSPTAAGPVPRRLRRRQSYEACTASSKRKARGKSPAAVQNKAFRDCMLKVHGGPSTEYAVYPLPTTECPNPTYETPLPHTYHPVTTPPPRSLPPPSRPSYPIDDSEPRMLAFPAQSDGEDTQSQAPPQLRHAMVVSGGSLSSSSPSVGPSSASSQYQRRSPTPTFGPTSRTPTPTGNTRAMFNRSPSPNFNHNPVRSRNVVERLTASPTYKYSPLSNVLQALRSSTGLHGQMHHNKDSGNNSVIEVLGGVSPSACASGSHNSASPCSHLAGSASTRSHSPLANCSPRTSHSSRRHHAPQSLPDENFGNILGTPPHVHNKPKRSRAHKPNVSAASTSMLDTSSLNNSASGRSAAVSFNQSVGVVRGVNAQRSKHQRSIAHDAQQNLTPDEEEHNNDKEHTNEGNSSIIHHPSPSPTHQHPNPTHTSPAVTPPHVTIAMPSEHRERKHMQPKGVVRALHPHMDASRDEVEPMTGAYHLPEDDVSSDEGTLLLDDEMQTNHNPPSSHYSHTVVSRRSPSPQQNDDLHSSTMSSRSTSAAGAARVAAARAAQIYADLHSDEQNQQPGSPPHHPTHHGGELRPQQPQQQPLGPNRSNATRKTTEEWTIKSRIDVPGTRDQHHFHTTHQRVTRSEDNRADSKHVEIETDGFFEESTHTSFGVSRLGEVDASPIASSSPPSTPFYILTEQSPTMLQGKTEEQHPAFPPKLPPAPHSNQPSTTPLCEPSKPCHAPPRPRKARHQPSSMDGLPQ